MRVILSQLALKVDSPRLDFQAIPAHYPGEVHQSNSWVENCIFAGTLV
jgi:hypothetical protein